MPIKDTTIRVMNGLRNVELVERQKPGDLVSALNLDLTTDGQLRRRLGRVKVNTGAAHSLWSDEDYSYCVRGSQLLRLAPGSPSYTTSVLASNLTPNLPVSFVQFGKRVYWSNAAQTGCIERGANRSWGIARPSLPVATASAGSLPEGWYLYTITYLRSDGQESGAPRVGRLFVPANGAIVLQSIPVSADPDVKEVALYISSANGSILYGSSRISNGVTSATISAVPGDLWRLSTMQPSPPPASQCLATFNAMILLAVGDTLFWSDPFSPELFHLSRDYVRFGSYITMVAPVDEGVFVGTTNKVVFNEGQDPASWTARNSTLYGAVHGTLVYADGSLIGEKNDSTDLPIWFSDRGPCYGTKSGEVVNMSEDKYLPRAGGSKGASLVKKRDGVQQVVFTVQY